MGEGDVRTLPSPSAPAAPTGQGRPKQDARACLKCGERLAYVAISREPSEDGSTIMRGRWSCTQDACRCRTASGDCRCSPFARTASPSGPTRTMNEADAVYLKGLRSLPEEELRELARFLATVRRTTEADAARAEMQRRHVKRERKRIAAGVARRMDDPIHTGVGAAMLRALEKEQDS